MEPLLVVDGETLESYFGMVPADQLPYEALYEDMVVTIIMIKNCGYGLIQRWLLQQHMGPNAQAYPTVLVKLVDMMNSGNFEADKPKRASNNNKNKNKYKNKNKDKNKEEETVGAIVGQAEKNTDTPSSDPESSDDDDTNTNDDEETSVDDNDNEKESDEDYSMDDDDEQENMRRVFAMISAIGDLAVFNCSKSGICLSLVPQ